MSKWNNRLVLKIIVFTGKLFLLFKKYSIIVLKEVILVNFKEVLNEYLKELNCSSKKLSNESGLSESVISRYRSGERTPLKNSEQLNKLTKALFNIAKDNDKNKYILVNKIFYGIRSIFTILSFILCRYIVINNIDYFKYLGVILSVIIFIVYLILDKLNKKILHKGV